MSIFDTFLNWKVFVQTLPLLLSGLTTTLTLGNHGHHPGLHRRARARSRSALRRFAASADFHRLYRCVPFHPDPGSPRRHLLRAPVRRDQAIAVRGRRLRAEHRFGCLFGRDFSRRHRSCSQGPVRGRPRGGSEFMAAHGRRCPASGIEDRHPSDHVEFHQRHEGHGPGVCRRHAGPPEASDAGAGACRKSDARSSARRSSISRSCCRSCAWSASSKSASRGGGVDAARLSR